MLKFIKKIANILLNVQDAIVQSSTNSFSASYSNTTSKRIFTNSASLELTSKTEQNKTKLEENVKTIVNKYKNDPNKLIAFVRKNGTKVYKLPFAEKLLHLIGFEQGFLSETSGLKSLYLNLITSILSGEKINFALKTDAMFILKKGKLDAYTTIQHFYKWHAKKLNLPGFDSNAQQNFQKFMTGGTNEQIKSLEISEILELKEAIARDMDAVNFVIQLAKSTEGSKQALKKIKLNGASV